MSFTCISTAEDPRLSRHKRHAQSCNNIAIMSLVMLAPTGLNVKIIDNKHLNDSHADWRPTRI